MKFMTPSDATNALNFFLGGPTQKEAVIDCTVVSDLMIKDLQDLCDMPVLPFSVQIDYIHNTPDWTGLD